MKKSFLTTVILVFSLLITSCNKNNDEPLPVDPVPISLTADQARLVDSGNEFAFDIFKKVTANAELEKNIIISPLSISVALSMTLNGADGSTRDGILETLRSNGITTDAINQSYKSLTDALLTVDKRILFSIAYSVWAEEDFPVKKQFTDKLTNYYQAETRTFSKSSTGTTVKEVNGWIEDKTNGLIREMLKGLEPNTVMMLINAVYFKGQWNSRFDKSKTVTEAFHISGSQSADVPMMKQTNKFKVFENEELILAELPYGQGNYVMDVIIPANGEGINNIIRTLTQESFNEITGKMTQREVSLSFPRFKYGYREELKEILADMGMGVAFTELADFRGISEIGILISMVLHQAFIETNEEGTEAAAATIIGFETTSIPTQPLTLRLDRPFFYVIRETTTNSIIFMGRVSDPAAE